MVPRRGLTVFAAVAFGAVASAAAYSEVHSTTQKAFKNSKLESVYVLNGVVPHDESVATAEAAGLITSAQMPDQFVPAGAVTDLSALGDRVAGSNLSTGEVVVGTMFVDVANAGGTAASDLPKGDVAVSVSLDQAQGVAGLIEPGDKVDILLDVDGVQESYLYQSVPVLAVGTDLAPPPGVAPSAVTTAASGAAVPAVATRAVTATGTGANTVITFAVSPAAAAHIASTKSDGGTATGVYLALQGPGSPTQPVAPITGSNLIPGSDLVLGGAAGSTGSTNTRGSTTTTGPGSTGKGSAGAGTTGSNTTGPNRGPDVQTP